MTIDPPGLVFERQFIDMGCVFVAGIDEAGRGAWAGPVCAAAVILPLRDPALSLNLATVRDSKVLCAAHREKAYADIVDTALAWSSGWASAEEVDAEGVVAATRIAMRRAVETLSLAPTALLVDGANMRLHLPQHQRAMNRGERVSLSIAAASIIAKVSRDRRLVEMDELYPGYGFARHKGYGTKVHREALAELGLTPEHRRSFAPIRRQLLESAG